MIKNQTPYLGKISLAFEKHPHHRGRTVLNKIHLNLGFTKLVSRIKPDRNENGFVLDPAKIKLIERYTNGVIGPHSFGPNQEHTLPYSFLTNDGRYVGSADDAWWYFCNGMTVCEEHPHGVALVWNTAKNDKTIVSGTNGLAGYYGYTHRGGALFEKGDRLFDEKYVPVPEDYTAHEWADYEKKRVEAQLRNVAEGWEGEVPISDVMPFKRRGKIVIDTWEQALEAAVNMSRYLS